MTSHLVSHSHTTHTCWFLTLDAISVIDHQKRRTCVIRKKGLPDVAVWNPWDKKSKSMVDFGNQEYKQMLCADGAVIEKPVNLKPGEEWKGKIQFTLVPSSFCTDGLNLDKRGF
ncbi:hypothetical protein TSUD_84960 [Trifolium subterraneum]|uniref:Glucose-6-phosphate 1-epimerase n=1 Tax=Trifolium subterraneum TaxID=3900 RepID=A0A2Z6MDX5_TRISU|nr:hypothetical protein TSUD_84960 [Trifolium subterraneum]